MKRQDARDTLAASLHEGVNPLVPDWEPYPVEDDAEEES